MKKNISFVKDFEIYTLNFPKIFFTLCCEKIRDS